MNQQTLKRTLMRLELQLLAAPQQQMFGGRNWRDDVPLEPGVYVLWDIKTQKPVYVGESGNLWDRFADLSRSVNHTCRRKMATRLGVPGSDEKRLSAAIAARYALSYIEVFLGRVELEEYLVFRWRDHVLNKPSPRLEKGTHYRWVQRVGPGRPVRLSVVRPAKRVLTR